MVEARAGVLGVFVCSDVHSHFGTADPWIHNTACTQLYAAIMASKACSCSSHGDIVRVTGTGSHKVWMVTGVAQILPFVSVSKNMFILGTGGNATSPRKI